jgi:cob(I)alamin adenosyltransferase
VAKSDARICALGEVDELNCVLGLLRLAVPGSIKRIIGSVQADLFDLGADLSRTGSAKGNGRWPGQRLASFAGPGRWKTSAWRMESGRAAWLEREAMAVGKGLPPPRGFMVPGGTPAAAWCHLGRAVCRRAERSVVASGVGKAGRGGGNPETARYLNRLSTLLFVVARRLAGSRAVEWRPARPSSS